MKRSIALVAEGRSKALFCAEGSRLTPPEPLSCLSAPLIMTTPPTTPLLSLGHSACSRREAMSVIALAGVGAGVGTGVGVGVGVACSV